MFQQIGGAGNAYSRFGHLGGNLTGSGDALRIKDGTQVGDQRTHYFSYSSSTTVSGFRRSMKDRRKLLARSNFTVNGTIHRRTGIGRPLPGPGTIGQSAAAAIPFKVDNCLLRSPL